MSSLKSFGSYCDTSVGGKLIYPAADRNKGPVLNFLKQKLPLYFSLEDNLNFLEISSGTGQHVAHFAPEFPNMTFQPTEYDENLLRSIGVYADECATKNIKQPILVDISKDLSPHGFVEETIDIIYNANLMQVSPYDCTIGLFQNAGKYLKVNGVMVNYGPFAINGVITPESNAVFDRALKVHDSSWGIRDLRELSALAATNKLSLMSVSDMPSNNKCVIWKKDL